MNVAESLPGSLVVQTGMVQAFVTEELAGLSDEIRRFTDRIPPQVRQAVMEEGIYLTGGSSQIPGIGEYMQKQLGCPVHVSKEYELCTASGLRQIITHDELQHWAFAPRPRRQGY
jgi:rod shape-determining protein MreB